MPLASKTEVSDLARELVFLGAPGRNRTYDLRFRKAENGVRSGSWEFAEMCSELVL